MPNVQGKTLFHSSKCVRKSSEPISLKVTNDTVDYCNGSQSSDSKPTH